MESNTGKLRLQLHGTYLDKSIRSLFPSFSYPCTHPVMLCGMHCITPWACLILLMQNKTVPGVQPVGRVENQEEKERRQGEWWFFFPLGSNKPVDQINRPWNHSLGLKEFTRSKENGSDSLPIIHAEEQPRERENMSLAERCNACADFHIAQRVH